MAHGTMEEKIYKRQVMGKEQNILGQSVKEEILQHSDFDCTYY